MHSRAEDVGCEVDFQYFEIGHSTEQATQELSSLTEEDRGTDVEMYQEQNRSNLTEAGIELGGISRRMAPLPVDSLPLFEKLTSLMQLNEEPGGDADERFDELSSRFREGVRRANKSVGKQGSGEEKDRKKQINVLLKKTVGLVEECREGFQAISEQEKEETAMALAA